MKGILFLCLTLLFSTGAVADHTTGIMAGAPEPIQECYATANIFQQLVVTRKAGLSLEETLDYHKYTMRIVKYITESGGNTYTEESEIEQNDRTRVVYKISEEDLASDVFLQDWLTAKYTDCIAAIPDELKPNNTDVQAIDRMLLPE
jgi:hypothetical protein